MGQRGASFTVTVFFPRLPLSQCRPSRVPRSRHEALRRFLFFFFTFFGCHGTITLAHSSSSLSSSPFLFNAARAPHDITPQFKFFFSEKKKRTENRGAHHIDLVSTNSMNSCYPHFGLFNMLHVYSTRQHNTCYSNTKIHSIFPLANTDKLL